MPAHTPVPDPTDRQAPAASGKSDPSRPMSRRRIVIGCTALAVGGLAPMATGLVGLRGCLTQGYFVAKTGQIVSGATAWIASAAFVLAGLGMMALARYQYRKFSRASATAIAPLSRQDLQK